MLKYGRPPFRIHLFSSICVRRSLMCVCMRAICSCRYVWVGDTLRTLSSSPSDSSGIYNAHGKIVERSWSGPQSFSQKWKTAAANILYFKHSFVSTSRQHNIVSFSRKRLIPFVWLAFIGCACKSMCVCVYIFASHVWSLHVYSRVFRLTLPFHFGIFRLPNGKHIRTHSPHTHTCSHIMYTYTHNAMASAENHQPYFYSFFLCQMYARTH